MNLFLMLNLKNKLIDKSITYIDIKINRVIVDYFLKEILGFDLQEAITLSIPRKLNRKLHHP